MSAMIMAIYSNFSQYHKEINDIMALDEKYFICKE